MTFNKFGHPQMPTNVVDEDIEMTDQPAASTAEVAAAGAVADGTAPSTNAVPPATTTTATNTAPLPAAP